MCLKVEPSLLRSKLNYTVQLFEDECKCIVDLLSEKNKRIYFIVLKSSGEYIVPLVYQHTFIEQIYVYDPEVKQTNASWINEFPKVRGCWTNFQNLVDAVTNDIQSILTNETMWSNERLIESCHTQTLLDLSLDSRIPLNPLNTTRYSFLHEQIRAVVLHTSDETLFEVSSEYFQLSEVFDVAQCVQQLNQLNLRSTFLIVSGTMNSIAQSLEAMPMLDQVYAVYLYAKVIHEEKVNKVLLRLQKNERLFDNPDVLLTCVANDILFYLEYLLNIPTMYLFESQNYISDEFKLNFTDKQKEFVILQLYLCTQRQARPSLSSSEEMYNRCVDLAEDLSHRQHILEILKSDDTQVFDWFTRTPFLSVIMNSFLKEEFPLTFLTIQSLLNVIDSRFDQLSRTTSLSAVYRVQLLTENDLQTLQNNVNALITFGTHLITSSDFVAVRMIARQAAERGLLVAVFEIEIAEGTKILDVDRDTFLYQFGAIFSIYSVDLSLDGVYYSQLRHAPSSFQTIKERLQTEVRQPLTWLTFGQYLRALNYGDTAQSYYDHLRGGLKPDDAVLSSVYSNLGLIHAELKEHEKALECYKHAQEILSKTSESKLNALEPIALEVSSHMSEYTHKSVNKCTILAMMAELYHGESKTDNALQCYRQALELDDRPWSRIFYEQKIQSILSARR